MLVLRASGGRAAVDSPPAVLRCCQSAVDPAAAEQPWVTLPLASL
jgi:hypothetical protein